MNKKALLADVVARTGVARAVLPLRRFLGDDLLILAYHRVLDIGEESTFPFDPELVSATPRDFAWQVEHVRRRYSPVTFRDVFDALDGRRRLPPRPVIISFDDGFEDNYTQAFPVLRRAGVPATFFIASGYVDSGQMYWFDLMAHVAYHAPPPGLEIPELGLSLALGRDIRVRRHATEKLVEALKHVPDGRRRQIVGRLEAAHAGSLPLAERKRSLPMSWDQVREMSRSGLEFGSHSVSHPVLTNLDDAALARELEDSKTAIERETGKPVDVLAYPIGQDFAYDARVMRTAQAAGYRMATSYISGKNRLRALDKFALRRLHVERYTRRADFAAMLSLPEIFS